MLMAFGMVCGLLEAQRSGQGQFIDAAMLDAASLVYAPAFAFAAARESALGRGTGEADSGAPYYDVYETSDGHYVSIGAMEPQFYRRLVELMGFDFAALPGRDDKANWPALKAMLAARFATKTRAEWDALLGEDNTCFAPVLTAREALSHPHAIASRAYREIGGVNQPAPAPRFSHSGETEPTGPALPGTDTDAVLRELGCSESEIASLRSSATVG
jgi:alpha-methylacyl-CoA racemase